MFRLWRPGFVRVMCRDPKVTIPWQQSCQSSLCSGVSGLFVCIKSLNGVQAAGTDLETGLKRCQMRAGHCVPPHGVSYHQAVEQGLLVKVSFRERRASSERQTESKACVTPGVVYSGQKT